MIAEIAAIVFALAGTGLILVASLGIVRMPDLLTRMHASSKAGTLGASLILVAVAISLPSTAIVMRVLLIILFLFLTAPLSAHMIARAGYRRGAQLCKETLIDDYREACENRPPKARGSGGAPDPRTDDRG